MWKVVDIHINIVIGSEGPCIFEQFESLFRLNGKVVLFHGLKLVASTLPYPAVAVIQNMKSFFIGEIGSRLDVAHGWKKMLKAF